MADLIDRDALMKDLRSDCPESDVCIAETSCIECIVGRQPALNRWIPCSERLPEENEPVLCYLRTGDFLIMELDGAWFEGIHRYSLNSVTHWMPLEPPEEVQE